jgi:hypothetical protein
MNRTLQEKRTLAEMARRFGQEPAPRLLAEIAELEDEEQQRQKREAELRERITADLTEIFGKVTPNELVQSSPPAAPPTAVPDATVLTETPADPQLEINIETPRLQDAVADYLSRQVRESTVVNPEPVLAQPQKDVLQEIKYLREWISRIAATGPGGGAGNILTLDTPVTVVNTSSYTVRRIDYYVGVNVSTSTSIVLPGVNTKAGRSLIIKDESGRCSVNPITISGTIDNDTSGAILAIDNGALHLIYRQGWRIV